MIVFQPSSETDWLEWRKQGVGASDVAALFKRHPFTSKQQLWERIVHGKQQHVNKYMQIGHEKEAVALDWLVELFPKWGEAKTQVCGVHDYNPLIRCTLDVYNENENAIAEIKFVKSASKIEDFRRKVPFHHNMQIQQQLMVSGAKYCFYITIGEDDKCAIETVYPDEALMTMIDKEVSTFWSNHIVTKVPPEAPVKSLNTPAVRKKVKRLIRLKRYVDEYAALKADLKPTIDTHREFVCSGIKCYRTIADSRLRYKDLVQLPCVQEALKANNINLEEYQSGETVAYRFVAIRDNLSSF